MGTAVREVIDFLTNPAIDMENTVDHLLFGDPESIVRGIATTFVATQEAIDQAMLLGVNLLVSHEGFFFSHRGKREVFQDDPVYRQKLQMIENSHIAIFRNHDHVHRQTPDIVTEGLLVSLGWRAFEVDRRQAWSVLEVPAMTVREILTHIQRSLDLAHLRYIGNEAMPCRRLGVLVGYRGTGELATPLFEKEDLDAVIYGEGPEWEAPEYVRDAVYQGRHKALVVLGHAESEMPGMSRLATRLQKSFPDIPVHFIPQKPVFQIS